VAQPAVAGRGSASVSSGKGEGERVLALLRGFEVPGLHKDDPLQHPDVTVAYLRLPEIIYGKDGRTDG
jgi:hypothetical protein